MKITSKVFTLLLILVVTVWSQYTPQPFSANGFSNPEYFGGSTQGADFVTDMNAISLGEGVNLCRASGTGFSCGFSESCPSPCYSQTGTKGCNGLEVPPYGFISPNADCSLYYCNGVTDSKHYGHVGGNGYEICKGTSDYNGNLNTITNNILTENNLCGGTLDTWYDHSNCPGKICLESWTGTIPAIDGTCYYWAGGMYGTDHLNHPACGVNEEVYVATPPEDSVCSWRCYGIFRQDDANVCNNHGVCMSLDTCACDPGYAQPECEHPTCDGILATDGNVCNGHGTCTFPDQCICDQGYYADGEPATTSGDISVDSTMCSDWGCYATDNNDPGVCGGHGNCVTYDVCECVPGYDNTPECNWWSCGAFENNDTAVCSGNGECQDVDTCVCNPGYFGTNCENSYVCYGKNNTDPTVCSGNGVCTATDTCSCFPEYIDDLCDHFECYGVRDDDPLTCNEHGNCTAPGTCVCDPNYFNGCTKFTCNGLWNSIPDPAGSELPWIPNPEVCNGHGSCVDPDVCSCDAGYDQEFCGWTCDDVPYTAPDSQICSGHGDCIDLNTCTCDTVYWVGDDCENDCTALIPGPPPVTWGCGNIDKDDPLVCGTAGICVSENVCVCTHAEYQVGNECVRPTHTSGSDQDCSPPSTTCPGNEQCAVGTCIGGGLSGSCTTDANCKEGICTDNGRGFFECLGASGSCQAAGQRCGPGSCSRECKTCKSGYYGTPSNLCAFWNCYGYERFSSNVCSSHGICTAPNTCSCVPGYSGNNCQHTTCDGVSSTSGSVCNGHGSCESQDICVCDIGWNPTTFCATLDNPLCNVFVPDWECDGLLETDPDVCNGDGECVNYNTCNCKPGWTGQFCDTLDCPELPVLCDPECVHGSCDYDTGICVCDSPEVTGESCDTAVCSPDCGTFGNCVYDGTQSVCVCDEGYTGQPCSECSGGVEECPDPNQCNGVYANVSTVCSGRGFCQDTGICLCDSVYSGVNCENPVCDPNCQNGGICVEPNKCDCGGTGFEGDYCEIPVCSACFHGICDAPESCSCNTGWEGVSCDTPICNPPCGPNGTCTSNGTHGYCSCNDGFTGQPCGQCPTGGDCPTTCFGIVYDNDNVCGSHGTCVAQDTCLCNDGYLLPECSNYDNTCPVCDSKTKTIFYGFNSNDVLADNSDYNPTENLTCIVGDCLFSLGGAGGFTGGFNMGKGHASVDSGKLMAIKDDYSIELLLSSYDIKHVTFVEPVIVVPTIRVGDWDIKLFFSVSQFVFSTLVNDIFLQIFHSGVSKYSVLIHEDIISDSNVFTERFQGTLLLSVDIEQSYPTGLTIYVNGIQVVFVDEYNPITNGIQNTIALFGGLPSVLGQTNDIIIEQLGVHNRTLLPQERERWRNLGFNKEVVPRFAEFLCFGVECTETKYVCSGHGRCIGENKCCCDNGWVGAECETVNGTIGSCPDPKPTKCNLECNNGKCVLDEGVPVCKCDDGWRGEFCLTSDCESGFCGEFEDCVGNNTCACQTGYSGTPCEPICSSCQWGTCVAPEQCVCNDGVKGSSCDQCETCHEFDVGTQTCIFDVNCLDCNTTAGDDKYKKCCEEKTECCDTQTACCDTQTVCCDEQSECCTNCIIELNTTQTELEDCLEFHCDGLLPDDVNVCSGHGICGGEDSCNCELGWHGTFCEIENPGPPVHTCNGILSTNPSVCNGGTCIADETCTCLQGWTGTYCDIECETIQCFGKLPNDPEVCGGHGVCEVSNKCDCEEGYFGGQCQNWKCFGKNARNKHSCGLNGDCVAPNQCECDPDWSGQECDVPICFGITGNNITVCSGHGKKSKMHYCKWKHAYNYAEYGCISPDVCRCQWGYYGEQCENAKICDDPRYYNYPKCNRKRYCKNIHGKWKHADEPGLCGFDDNMVDAGYCGPNPAKPYRKRKYGKIYCNCGFTGSNCQIWDSVAYTKCHNENTQLYILDPLDDDED